MTLATTSANLRVPAVERVPVRCVDSDVHPTPRRGELGQYIPKDYQKFFGTHPVGEQIYYDAPDYAHSYAMRVDTFPADSYPPIVYPAALIAGRNNAGAPPLLDYLKSDAARAVWEQYGFDIAR